MGPSYRDSLELECATRADELLRKHFSDEIEERDRVARRLIRLPRHIRAMYDKIYFAIQRGDSVEFLEERAARLVEQKELLEDELADLSTRVQKHWDALFLRCYDKLKRRKHLRLIRRL